MTTAMTVRSMTSSTASARRTPTRSAAARRFARPDRDRDRDDARHLRARASAEDATTDERCATRRVFERAFEGRDRDHGLAVAESAESRALANGDEWFYGELEFDAARALLRRCAPNGESGEFVDLGSGLGKMVVAAALSGRFSRARGVELLRELHVEATEGLRAYERALGEEVGGSGSGDDDGGDVKDLATARRCEVTLEEGNLLTFDVSTADVVYIHATCFTPGLLDATGMKLAQEMRPGARVIIMSKQFPEEWVFRPFDGGYAAVAQPQSKWKLDCFLYEIVK